MKNNKPFHQRYLLRLAISLALLATTYWMMPWPAVAGSLLALSLELLVIAIYCWAIGKLALARVLVGFALPVVVPIAIFWAMGQPLFWQSNIEDYEKSDQASAPQPGVIVFTGSSSMRHWETLSEDMKPLKVVNRAFGGSQISLVSFYASRIVTVYKPSAVVLYAGDNDLAFPLWKTPETVLEDFKTFVHQIHSDMPQTWIYYISMKPAPWGNWTVMEITNHMIEAYSQTEARVQYIDVSSAMLDAQGKLRSELYGMDPMHINKSGYVLWTSIVKPVLMERFGSVK